MPIKVVDEERIRNWPDEYVGEFRNALIEDKEIKIDNIVNESTTSLDIEFDIEDFITEGLEEVEKLKEMKIFDILKEMGGKGREALSLLVNKKVDPNIAKKYENYTLGDIIDDDFKRNQLIGYSFFAYEKEGETEEGRGIYKPTRILSDTLDMGSARVRDIKGIPDLDWQDIRFTKESEEAIEEMKKFRTKFSSMEEVDPQYQKYVEEELQSIPTMLEVGDMEQIQQKHMLKYYDSLEKVPVSEPPVKMTKNINFDKDGSFKEKIARVVAGNLNPSILGEISITLNNIVNDTNSFSADLTIIQEQDARFEIRPFGGDFRRKITGKMSDEDFVEFIEGNMDRKISEATVTVGMDSEDKPIKERYVAGASLGEMKPNVFREVMQIVTDKETSEEKKFDLINRLDSIEEVAETLAAIRMLKRLRSEFTGKSTGEFIAKPLGEYKANIKMDDVLQDIEERYVNLEDDIANAKDLIGVED